MTSPRRLLLAAAIVGAGALITLVAASLLGMRGEEIAHLATLLGGAAAVSVALIPPVGRALARTSLHRRLAAASLAGVLVGLLNLAVLAALMVVDRHDALLIGALLAYAAAAGIAAAVALAREPAGALRRVSTTARKLAAGDLDARVGPIRGGRELEALGGTLDEMAERLKRSLAHEREIEERRRDLVTAVSHDLRTPLAGLRAIVEAVEDGVVDDPPTLGRYLGEIRRSVEVLVSLVDDLFEFAQLDAGAIQAEADRARVGDLVRSAVAACEAHASRKGLSLETKLDGGGDALCSPRLTRVLQNLLQNAIRHTPSDGTVRLHVRRAPGRLELVVEDEGDGIAPEVLPRVFDPFWRGDAARSSAGSGLGLALAKRIVEALGGEIKVASQPAKGSRFAVVLPYGT